LGRLEHQHRVEHVYAGCDQHDDRLGRWLDNGFGHGLDHVAACDPGSVNPGAKRSVGDPAGQQREVISRTL
jgi:hypothetical protein